MSLLILFNQPTGTPAPGLRPTIKAGARGNILVDVRQAVKPAARQAISTKKAG